MRLKVFDTIDSTLDLLEKNHSFYREVEDELHEYIEFLMRGKREMVVDINSRIKSKDSLREKIIRNRFYVENNSAQEILDSLSDLVGFIIECRFIEDEFNVLKVLRDKLNRFHEEDGYYYNEVNPNFFLDVASRQPQIQKNGFAIYRIDGYYLKDGMRVNVELQIKALVHSFWGEIEHKLVYKNTNYYVYDDFMKDLLASIKANLTITDRQLNIIYNQMQESSVSDTSITEGTFEKQISKAINDLFARKMNESIGFTMNIKNTSTILGHYIFLKDIRYDGGSNDRVTSLFKTFKKLNSIDLDFENEIEIEEEFLSQDIFIHILGNYLLSIINTDYDWYVFFNMLFAIEPGNNMEDFCMFLNVIKNYLVDNYWLNTSFVKLPMDQSDLLHEECSKILAESLCEIGTIHIIYDDKMVAINHAFVTFIEELEGRVISYSDFMEYRNAYYDEWMKRVYQIFQS
ncbi:MULTISPECIES: RelA/spoT family protein [Bacillota]|uniref:RelA/spoT family protein n=2 Tax=Amedibacillus TaxID=2749846 RepID=A0A7G9GMJ2_9FIRM|nr:MULTISPECIES: RelA/spoT family protein [Bacillota]QNM12024.1 RelA/spoT family protein [[Eubacterium] hominis]MCH4286626.1 RelA/spoT family protein [Amedibacillus hominis]RGB53091.1 RelA/spoT family protein [Absiella sp. AM22-9]RGB59382.1 RelA/spoT family protein [Absiella sp. AM10-20]RGB66647.1 RelA/spoT family protein [Absiella sp. AM09-45]